MLYSMFLSLVIAAGITISGMIWSDTNGNGRLDGDQEAVQPFPDGGDFPRDGNTHVIAYRHCTDDGRVTGGPYIGHVFEDGSYRLDLPPIPRECPDGYFEIYVMMSGHKQARRTYAWRTTETNLQVRTNDRSTGPLQEWGN